MTHVILDRLTKRFGNVTVVDSVDLSIKRGELVCVLGPSGCGKTTTLRLVAGFIEPTAGEIRIGDRLLSAPGRTVPPERRNMSMIFQSYALWPHMTIAENVAYGLTLRPLDRAAVSRRVAEMLRVVRLEELAERYPAELSGGQQQRAALARALVVEPDTLLLDEPLSNLDAALREEMRFEVRRLHDEFRYTTLYVTHDQAEAMTAADRIVVMNGGRIEQIGTPEDVYNRPRSEFVARFLGGTNILKGAVVDGARLAVAGTVLRCAESLFDHGRPGALSIRHHDVRVLSRAPDRAENVLEATVTRQIFLGSVRDFALRLGDGTALRAAAPPDLAIPAEARVWAELPPDRCRPLLA